MNVGAVTATHRLHRSLEEMLSPDAMSRIEGRPVASVHSRSWVPDDISISGCPFLWVETTGVDGERGHYVVKRTGHERDLIMRDTGDRVCREMLVWQHGLLDRLPAEAAHTIVAVSEDGDGWSILMRAVTDALQPYARWPEPGWAPPSLDDTHTMIDAMAALHERYWEDPALLDPALGLCPLPSFYASLSPAVAEREAQRPNPRIIPNRRAGWKLLEELVAPDLAQLVRALHINRRPLCDALGRYPWTFVHGDLKCANIGLEDGAQRRVVLLDWQFATRAPPAVDLTWWLSMFAGVLPISLDEAIDVYRGHLARRLGDRFDARWWQPQLELAVLGEFVRHAHHWMHPVIYETRPAVREHFRALLAWWTARMRAGAALL
jgi:hypothetical protein